MFSIGLTGGIGSGKSQVAQWLGQWGASVIDTDEIARDLTRPGGQAMAALRQAFGEVAVAADGGLDRAWMRAHAFADPAARQRLEAIVHPLIEQAVQRQAAQAGGAYVVYVVPLLVETGRWRQRVDRVCVVDCDPDTQVRRVGARSGLTPEAIGRIMSAQAPRETRLAAADDVIINDGATSLDALRQQSWHFHQSWARLASQRLVRDIPKIGSSV
ncbi:dephospho-CoA kinase [Castellaniella hirudinis]|uniref:dephospho-CoA kinase n=1 Tax=Castellaniella hirudinis TaxID=1144617 RepID=UPI0039C1460A